MYILFLEWQKCTHFNIYKRWVSESKSSKVQVKESWENPNKSQYPVWKPEYFLYWSFGQWHFVIGIWFQAGHKLPMTKCRHSPKLKYKKFFPNQNSCPENGRPFQNLHLLVCQYFLYVHADGEELHGLNYSYMNAHSLGSMACRTWPDDVPTRTFHISPSLRKFGVDKSVLNTVTCLDGKTPWMNMLRITNSGCCTVRVTAIKIYAAGRKKTKWLKTLQQAVVDPWSQVSDYEVPSR